MDQSQRPPGLGHNVSPAMELPAPEALYEAWSREHAALLGRRDQLLAAMERFEGAHGAGIADEGTAARAADFVLLLEREAGNVEAARKRIKAPLLAVGRALDRLLKKETSDRLAAAAAKVKAMLGEYQARKIAAERARLEQQAMAARQAADAAAASAAGSGDPASREQAISLDRVAQRAELAATEGIMALARTRGASGTVAELREEWTYEVVDIALVPRQWLTIDDRKVRAAIRGPGGLRGIDGLRIYAVPTASVR